MKKKGLLIGLLLMAVGFASVTTTLYINGTSTVKKNDGDFKVYYSNAKVNGTQDLTVVESETSLKFTTTLDTLGQTYVLDYDITNGSKNYDADLEMVCTGGNDYLTVTNNFDTATNLSALQTRSGKLTLTLAKSYTGDDLDVTIQCNIKANAVERNSLGEGAAASPVEPQPLIAWIYNDIDGSGDISVGDEYSYKTEKFNVISNTSSTIKLLAQYSLNENFMQDKRNATRVTFSNLNGWEYTPGPKEIDIQAYDGNAKTYVNKYVSYLQTETGDTTITGDLITLAELKTLGCTIYEDYERGTYHCRNSSYKDWLFTRDPWFTRSAVSSDSNEIFDVFSKSAFHDYEISNVGFNNEEEASTIRPTITIQKNTPVITLDQTIAVSICKEKGYEYGIYFNQEFVDEVYGYYYLNDENNTETYDTPENATYLCSNYDMSDGYTCHSDVFDFNNNHIATVGCDG